MLVLAGGRNRSGFSLGRKHSGKGCDSISLCNVTKPLSFPRDPLRSVHTVELQVRLGPIAGSCSETDELGLGCACFFRSKAHKPLQTSDTCSCLLGEHVTSKAVRSRGAFRVSNGTNLWLLPVWPQNMLR